jgi:hypothetical protein
MGVRKKRKNASTLGRPLVLHPFFSCATPAPLATLHQLGNNTPIKLVGKVALNLQFIYAMTTRNSALGLRVQSAAEIRLRAPALSIPEAMRTTGIFSGAEVKDRTIQMKVRRLYDKLKQPAPPSSILPINGTSDLSPLTVPTIPSLRESGMIDDGTASSEFAAAAAASSLQAAATAAAQSIIAEPTPKRKKRNHTFLEGMKEIRKNSTQIQQARINKKKTNDNAKAAHKEATTLLSLEKQKENGMSARQVTETINQKYGTTLARRTVADYVNKGMIGMSPVKKGKSFCIPPDVFQMLLIAYESFIRINQLNSTTSKCNRSSLTKLVNVVTNKMFSSHFLFNKLLSESTVDFQAAVISPVEELQRSDKLC